MNEMHSIWETPGVTLCKLLKRRGPDGLQLSATAKRCQLCSRGLQAVLPETGRQALQCNCRVCMGPAHLCLLPDCDACDCPPAAVGRPRQVGAPLNVSPWALPQRAAA